MNDLGTLGGKFSQGLALNSQWVVVGYSTLARGEAHHAIIYYDGVMYDLNVLLVPNDNGLLLGGAVGINDAGQIAANGCATSTGGECHAFLLTPVPNLLPIASAGADQTVAVGSLVTLDGSASVDPDKGPGALQYAWSQTGGSSVSLTSASGVAPTFLGATPGVYRFSLVVRDGQDNSAPDSVTIMISPVVAGPVTKDQCKHGGWKSFEFPRTFKNQGDCVQFVNTGK
jgi:probable HAF family extracellular repeat protein